MSDYKKLSSDELRVIREKTEALSDADFSAHKDRFKRIRTTGEILVVLAVIALLANLFLNLRTYHPFPASAVNDSAEDTGFVALSYFGVDRIGDSSTLIGKDALRQQLQALHDQGYVTISQKDITAYYKEGKPLPRKALFLMFEDGRRDTAIFAQEILEDLNYKATMMTYPEKFDNHDPKFLMPKELKDMEDMTFWEMGTNGYRLEYINVFDRYNRYLGEIDPLHYAMMQSYLGRRYNHYLMDYLRDKDGMPRESYDHMKRRIEYDYTRLRDIYEDELGYVPGAHVLMHANTGKFGNNNDVSAVNEKWIRNLFAMNFNREGYCFNQHNSSIYDLTRMQPQPYWAVNHLLMRIKYDINQPITFIQGDTERQKDWTLQEGASEIKEEQFLLTTLPKGEAMARLNNSNDYRDVWVSCQLEGNAFGGQYIYLRAKDDKSSFIRVGLINDQLSVTERRNGQDKVIYKEKIPVIKGEKILSVDEDSRDAEVRENETFARYASSPEMMKEYASREQAAKDKPVATVEDGAEPYEGQQSFHRRGDHKLSISLRDDKITVLLDDVPALTDAVVTNTDRGSICLGASWKGEAWSQRNLADDVYDAVFNHLRVTANTGKADMKDEKPLYSLEFTGWQKARYQANAYWEKVLRWFLKYL